MADVLKSYAPGFGDDTVLVCLDETPRQKDKVNPEAVAGPSREDGRLRLQV